MRQLAPFAVVVHQIFVDSGGNRVENERIAHIRDGVAVTKFIYWLKKNVGRIPITELSAAEKLYEFRSEQEDFIDNSFDPIIAYGKHAELDPSSYQIVDIRDAVEISHGAIPGALAMKTEEIETSDAIDRTKKMIICCSRGRFSVAAADEAGQEKEVHSCTEK